MGSLSSSSSRGAISITRPASGRAGTTQAEGNHPGGVIAVQLTQKLLRMRKTGKTPYRFSAKKQRELPIAIFFFFFSFLVLQVEWSFGGECEIGVALMLDADKHPSDPS